MNAERPSCVTEWLRSPIDSTPLLGSLPEFGRTEYVTVPLPVPVLPAETAIQSAFDAAVQEQPAAAVTVTEPVPPSVPNVPEPGAMTIEQIGVGSTGDPSPPQLP